MSSASAATRAYRFDEAYRHFLSAYDHRRRSADDLMRAARALQMSETWRAQAGAWEALGNEIGIQLDNDVVAEGGSYKYPPGREFVGRFYVISDDEWARVDSPCPDGCATKCRMRQKQAYAFEWAAEAAASSANNADAARLYRRAAWAWEKAIHYGVPQTQHSPSTPPQFPETRRLRRAARCYAEAAANAVLTSRPATRAMIAEQRWCPACILDKHSEENCRHDHVHAAAQLGAEDTLQTDIERLRRCWEQIAAIEQDRTLSSSQGATGKRFWRLHARTTASRAEEEAIETGADQMSAIQGLLASKGQTRAAREIYRIRKQYLRHCWHGRRLARRWASQLMSLLSKNGSSAPRLLLSMGVLYLVIIPAGWLAAWKAGAPAPLPPSHGPLPAEALLFSLSSVTNFSNGHFSPGGWISSALQVIEGLSAYFSLGYLLYVAQRSYTI